VFVYFSELTFIVFSYIYLTSFLLFSIAAGCGRQMIAATHKLHKSR